jgi:hypothetical protein
VRDEISARHLDVGYNWVQALGGARRRLRDPGPESDRARRAGRRDLHDADDALDPGVDQRVEAGRLGGEGLGAVHVRDENQHQFELEVHDSRAAGW